MPRILRHPRAAADIAESRDYIAENNLAAADAFIDRLDAALQRLAHQLRLGRARDELAAGLRSFPFERYVIFYEPLADGIVFVRLLHGARDIDAQFGAGDLPAD